MKLNSSINLQNNSWKGTSKHVNRSYVNSVKKYDSNPDINLQRSHYNISTDGYIQSNIHSKIPTWHFDKNKFNSQEKRLDKDFQNTYKDYVIQHNNSKSVRRHPKRRIHNIRNKMIGKANSKKRSKVEHSFSLPVTTNNIIKIVAKHKHINFRRAKNSVAKQVSKSLYNTMIHIHLAYPSLDVTHMGTNVDEDQKPNSKLSDCMQVQGDLVGLSWTKLDKNFKPTPRTRVPYKSGKRKGQLHWKAGSKPSTSLDRAICQAMHVKYSRKVKRVKHGNGYKTINISASKALSMFNDALGRIAVKQLQRRLYHHYGYNEFKHIQFSRTNPDIVGLSQADYQNKAETEHKQDKINRIKAHKRLVAHRRHLRQAKARRRTYLRNYKRSQRAKSNTDKFELANNSLVYKTAKNKINSITSTNRQYYSSSANSYCFSFATSASSSASSQVFYYSSSASSAVSSANSLISYGESLMTKAKSYYSKAKSFVVAIPSMASSAISNIRSASEGWRIGRSSKVATDRINSVANNASNSLTPNQIRIIRQRRQGRSR